MNMKMKRIFVTIITGFLALSLAACTHTERQTAKWGAGGAAVGALGGAVLGHGSGAVLGGAAAGAAVGSLIGYSRTHKGVEYCKYRDKHGRIHEAKCDHRR